MKAIEIGAFEAKTHLSSLLEKVRQNELFYITKHGKRIAILQKYEEKESEKANPCDVFNRFRRVRLGSKSGSETLKDLIEAGRRF